MDCKFYLHGKCSKGGACEFRHNAMVKAEYEAGIAKDCTFFAGGRGKCARLETCRFLHLPAANHDASGAAIGDTDVRDHDMGRRPDRRHDALGGGRMRAPSHGDVDAVPSSSGSAPPAGRSSSKPCIYYAQGRCAKAEMCPFAHVLPTGAGGEQTVDATESSVAHTSEGGGSDDDFEMGGVGTEGHSRAAAAARDVGEVERPVDAWPLTRAFPVSMGASPTTPASDASLPTKQAASHSPASIRAAGRTAPHTAAALPSTATATLSPFVTGFGKPSSLLSRLGEGAQPLLSSNPHTASTSTSAASAPHVPTAAVVSSGALTTTGVGKSRLSASAVPYMPPHSTRPQAGLPSKSGTEPQDAATGIKRKAALISASTLPSGDSQPIPGSDSVAVTPSIQSASKRARLAHSDAAPTTTSTTSLTRIAQDSPYVVTKPLSAPSTQGSSLLDASDEAALKLKAAALLARRKATSVNPTADTLRKKTAPISTAAPPAPETASGAVVPVDPVGVSGAVALAKAAIAAVTGSKAATPLPTGALTPEERKLRAEAKAQRLRLQQAAAVGSVMPIAGGVATSGSATTAAAGVAVTAPAPVKPSPAVRPPTSLSAAAATTTISSSTPSLSKPVAVVPPSSSTSTSASSALKPAPHSASKPTTLLVPRARASSSSLTSPLTSLTAATATTTTAAATTTATTGALKSAPIAAALPTSSATSLPDAEERRRRAEAKAARLLQAKLSANPGTVPTALITSQLSVAAPSATSTDPPIASPTVPIPKTMTLTVPVAKLIPTAPAAAFNKELVSATAPSAPTTALATPTVAELRVMPSTTRTAKPTLLAAPTTAPTTNPIIASSALPNPVGVSKPSAPSTIPLASPTNPAFGGVLAPAATKTKHAAPVTTTGKATTVARTATPTTPAVVSTTASVPATTATATATHPVRASSALTTAAAVPFAAAATSPTTLTRAIPAHPTHPHPIATITTTASTTATSTTATTARPKPAPASSAASVSAHRGSTVSSNNAGSGTLVPTPTSNTMPSPVLSVPAPSRYPPLLPAMSLDVDADVDALLDSIIAANPTATGGATPLAPTHGTGADEDEFDLDFDMAAELALLTRAAEQAKK